MLKFRNATYMELKHTDETAQAARPKAVLIVCFTFQYNKNYINKNVIFITDKWTSKMFLRNKCYQTMLEFRQWIVGKKNL